MRDENTKPTVSEICPSCQATDNTPYVDANGVAMRACGRCMIQWREAVAPPQAAPTEQTYWCCSAGFGKHDSWCPNFVAPQAEAPTPTQHNCNTDDRALAIDRPCSACSAGDEEMKYHLHCPPFRVGAAEAPKPDPFERAFNPQTLEDWRDKCEFLERELANFRRNATARAEEIAKEIVAERLAAAPSVDQLAITDDEHAYLVLATLREIDEYESDGGNEKSYLAAKSLHEKLAQPKEK
jgi:hypothetical protein